MPVEECIYLLYLCGVGIATRYVLDGPGIESQLEGGGGEGARFSAPVQTGPAARPASYTMGTGSFPGGKVAGAEALTNLEPRLKKEQSYVSTSLGLRGVF